MKRERKKPQAEIAVVEAAPHKGLSKEEVSARIKAGLSNNVKISAGRSEWGIIARNLFTFFNLLFLVLSAALVLSGAHIKNLAFLGVVACNLFVGCFQEIRAKRALDKLTLVASEKIRTVRDGKMEILSSEDLVRDDIVEFVAGDQICADGLLLDGKIQVNEALITGEEDAIEKSSGDKLLSGSFVVSGKARVRLTAVGEEAFAAKLAKAAKENPHAAKSEMMHSLDKLIRWVGIALIPTGIALFCNEYFRLDGGLSESTNHAVASLIGMIPSGLYLLTSIAMAASSLKLTRDKVLVKDLNCIEALARVDVLCVDKTGTITEPGMEVEQVISLNDAPATEILTAICAGMEPENDTARAIIEKFSGDTDWVLESRIPFTSETKWSAAIFREGAYVVGAPELVMGSRYEEIRQSVEEQSARGSRVLLLAAHGTHVDKTLEESILQPLALVVLSNRIRASAPKTFAYFREQGVNIKVISGDNPITVSQVALRAGISGAEKYVDASTLQSEEAIRDAAVNCTVFGRVTPDMKRALLRAMKDAGHTVAMTGDGVNDVLALKEADCSIAMASGAQAAGQVAQLVLTESDFSAMPAIVGEGRRVINNIQRAASLFLVKNMLSMGLAIVCLIMGYRFPFEPIHLTLISSLTIGLPSFFLAMEPNYERVRGRFLPTVLGHALPGGLSNLLIVAVAMGILTPMGVGKLEVSTVCVAVLAMVGLAVLYRTCIPFGWFRRALWITMTAALVLCFTLLSRFFDLTYGNRTALFTMMVLLAIVPVIYILLHLLVRRLGFRRGK